MESTAGGHEREPALKTQDMSGSHALTVRATGLMSLRTTYIWLAALAAACLLTGAFAVNSAQANIASYQYGALFSDTGAGAGATYVNTFNWKITPPATGDTSRSAIRTGDDLKKLVMDWPTGLQGDPNAMPPNERCNGPGAQPGTGFDYNGSAGGLGVPADQATYGGSNPANYAACPASSKIGRIRVDVDVSFNVFLFGDAECRVRMRGDLYLLRNRSVAPLGNPFPEVPTYIGIALVGNLNESSGGHWLCGAAELLVGAQAMSLTAKIDVRPHDQGLRIAMLNDMPRRKAVDSALVTQDAWLKLRSLQIAANAKTPAGNMFLRNPTRCLPDTWNSITYAQTYDQMTPQFHNPVPLPDWAGPPPQPPWNQGSGAWYEGGALYTNPDGLTGTFYKLETPDSIVSPRCDTLPDFEPQFDLELKNNEAGAPVGMKATLIQDIEPLPHIAQQSYIKKVSMALPKEFRINPAVAERLQNTVAPFQKSGCTEAEFNKADPLTVPTCPWWSEIGTAASNVPQLSSDLVGKLYLGQPLPGDMQAPSPGDPDRRAVFRLYLNVLAYTGDGQPSNPAGGVGVKFEGRARVNQTLGDPNYGQIDVEFGDPSYSHPLSPGLPQLMYKYFILDFDATSQGVGVAADRVTPIVNPVQHDMVNRPNDADRQMLMNPQVCGTYEMDTTFTPWTTPAQGDFVDTVYFPIGPANHAPTPTHDGETHGGDSCNYKKFKPTFSVRLTEDYDFNTPGAIDSAGPVDGAGTHPTMTFKVTRTDREDNLKNLKFIMPEGFGGSIKATNDSCSVATLSGIADGSIDPQGPSGCPDAAKIGDVSVTTGAGPAPITLYGGIYIMDRADYSQTPPDPLGVDRLMGGTNELTKYTAKLAVVTPAEVGPFKLGAVVNKLYMRLASSDKFQLAAETDYASGLDQSIRGIPVLYRDITLKLAGINDQGTPGNTADDRPFLILPSQCGVSLMFQGVIESEGAPPNTTTPPHFGPEVWEPTSTPIGAPVTTGCSAQQFTPTVEISNFETTPSTPTGMSMKVNVPQVEAGATYSTVQQSTIQRMRVQFPAGLDMNPAVAHTLEACPTSAIDADLANPDADTNTCADDFPKSKLGEVFVNTPLLPNLHDDNDPEDYAVEGSMYLEQQGTTADDRFRFVLYLQMPGGMQIVRGGARIAGSTNGPTAGLGSTAETTSDVSVIDGTPLQTGQLEADFDGLPDVPYRWIKLNFEGGRAEDNHIVGMFVTPDTCGVNSAKVRVNANNNNATTVPPTAPDANVFFNTPGDPDLSFTTAADPTHPCVDDAEFTPTAEIELSKDEFDVPQTRAASHPDYMTARIERADMQKDLKEVTFQLPAGMTGAPASTDKCPIADASNGYCDADTQIGSFVVALGSGDDLIEVDGEIFNTETTDPEEPARLTGVTSIALGPFDLGRMSLPIYTSFRDGDIGLNANVILPQRFEGIKTHYRRMDLILHGQAANGKPFLQLPSKCQTNTLVVDAIAADGTPAENPVSERSYSFDTTGCPFDFPSGSLPTLEVIPDNTRSEEPTGLSLNMTNGTADSFNSTIGGIKIEFPFGMTVNPAVGLDGDDAVCESSVIDAGGSGCPAESVRGEVTVKTPLLEGEFNGFIYLEEPGSTKETRFRLALVIDLPGTDLVMRGVTKISGSSDLDGPTGAINTGNGQITAEFDDVVDLSFYDLKLELYGGPKALLVNPPTCGSAVIEGSISPHTGLSNPDYDVETYSTYEVTHCQTTPPAPEFNAWLSPGRVGDDQDDAENSAGHPTFNLEVNNLGKSPQLAEFNLQLPTGFVADTVQTPRCDEALAIAGNCPANTIVGSVDTTMGSPTLNGSPIPMLTLGGNLYNFETTDPDEPARLGAIIDVVVGPFELGKLSIPVTTEMRPDYGINTFTTLPHRYEGIDIYIRQMTLSVFGYTQDENYDEVPFMINPTTCGPHTVTAEVIRRSGPPVAPIDETININGCPRVFTDQPGLTVTPSTTETAMPVGLKFEIENTIDNPTLKSVAMTMPQGMEINPAFANDLNVCTTEQINAGMTSDPGAEPSKCPEANAIGEVTLDTPLLPDPQFGKVFIETPLGNDAATRYRTAIVVELPGKNLISRGTLQVDGSTTIEPGGKGAVNSGTGQMTTTFFGDDGETDLPDLAFSKMTVDFTGGSTGLFTNPRACGLATFEATVTPHGNDDHANDETVSDDYTTTTDCGAPGFDPTFGGSANPTTSAASPTLTMTASSPPKDEDIKQLDIDLPTGLVAATGNVPTCSVAAASQGNCDAASDVGDVSASMGSSSLQAENYTISGDLFNVAPAADEPARLSARINVLVGPFDLGRLTIPITAELRDDWGVTTFATLPHRYEGISVRMRSMSIQLASTVGGERFAINPSKCQNNVITARMKSHGGVEQSKTDSWNFTTTGCAPIPEPTKPTIEVSPSTTQAGVPVGLRIDINSDDSNPTLERTEFTFPSGFEINPAFAKDLVACGQALDVNGDPDPNWDPTADPCPAASKVADITMTTHLMHQRPQGKLFILTPGDDAATRFRVAMVLELPGKTLVLHGKINIDGATDIAGGTGSTSDTATGQLSADFDGIPDLGFTQLRLDFTAGSKAMLVNPTQCTPHTFTAEFTPHSSSTKSTATTDVTPTNCGASFAPNFIAQVSDTAAGGHPDLDLIVTNSANQQEIRELKIKLPVGLVANTTAAPQCSQADAADGNCLPVNEVGSFETKIGSTDKHGAVDDRVSLGGGKIYNVVPGPDAPARMQAVMDVEVGPFDLGKLSIPVLTKLNPDMSVDADTLIPARYEGIAVKVREMTMHLEGNVGPNSFMVNPSRCATHQIVGVMKSEYGLTRTVPQQFTTTGCGALPYNPTLSVTNDPQTAGAPTDLTVQMTLPPSSSTTSNVKMTFPAGLEISPGAGEDLASCDPSDVADGGDLCPASSRLASVSLITPLLPGVQTGDLYLEPSIGRSASTRFRLSMVIDLPGQHLVIRGGTLVDGASDLQTGVGSKNTGDGHVTATFPGLPDLGFTDLTMTFDGSRSLFVNPKNADTHTIVAELTPHASATPVVRNPTITTVGGTSLVTDFEPEMTGSLTPATTGGNPDLNLTITNQDGMEEIEKIDINLPEGLVARTQGVPQCAAANAAVGNCAPANTVGTISATIGSSAAADGTLTINNGSIVNVVPAADQPARLFAIVPVVVGPFDLGKLTVDVPTKLNDDLSVTASTELPERYEGIAVRVRELQMTIQGTPSGGTFLVAPSKCGPGQVSADFTSGNDLEHSDSFGFNVTGCPLGFVNGQEPSMAISAAPSTRNAPTNLTFTLTSAPENPTLRAMRVEMPDNMEINPAFGKDLEACDSDEITDNAGVGCPEASKVGVVTLKTHLLNPNTNYYGTVYLEEPTADGAAATRFRIAIVVQLPGADLVVRGKVTVVGSTDLIDGKGSTTYEGPGKIFAEFDDIPDLGFNYLKVQFNTNKPMLINPPSNGNFGLTFSPHSDATSGSDHTQNVPLTVTGSTTPVAFNPTFDVASSSSVPGGHPDLTISVGRSNNNMDVIKELDLALPVGLVASTVATDRCPQLDAENGNCAADTRVGTFATRFGNGATAPEDLTLNTGYIHNVMPSNNEPARLAAIMDVEVGPFDLGMLSIPIETVLRPDAGIDTTTTLPVRYEGIAVRIKQVDITLFGEVDGEPFMQNPSKCGTHTIRAQMTSAGSSTVGKQKPITISGCPLPFAQSPGVAIDVDPRETSVPTALSVEVTNDPDNSTIGKIEMEMPEGMSVNAAVGNHGNNLVCATAVLNSDHTLCPAGSRQGTVELETPLLGDTYGGFVYLEEPVGNDVATRYRLAIALDLPGQTILVRGRVKLNGSTTIPTGGTGSQSGTGRVETVFESLPDLSFSRMSIEFEDGPRAMLTNPDECGDYAIRTTLTPTSGGPAVEVNPEFTVDQDCQVPQPFNPTISIDTLDPDYTAASGANTNLGLVVSGGSKDQQIRDFTIHLPSGLIADTDATDHCSQTDATAGNCGPTSLVGTAVTQLGTGSETLDVNTGEIHNVTPNSDEPARMVAIMPVQVGPYDLGKLSIPVRTELRRDGDGRYGVDATTQIPTLYEGVRVRIKEMRMTMLGTVAGNGFIKNPSRCTAGTGADALTATFVSAPPASTEVNASANYPVTGCPIDFGSDPTITISGTSSEVEQPTGMTLDITSDEANPTIASVLTTMPEGMTLNPAVGNTVAACSSADVDASLDDYDACPSASVVGQARMETPLLKGLPENGGMHLGKLVLEEPGPNNNADDRYRLAMIVDLPGKNVIVRGVTKVNGTSDLVGGKGSTAETGNPAVDGRVTAEFEDLPDLNFTHLKLEFEGGPQALLANSSSCGTQTIAADFLPQSGDGSTAVTTASDSYETSFDGQGAPCPGTRTWAPTFEADVTPVDAAGNPNVTMRVSRSDKQQQFKEFNLHLPPGLVADSVSTPRCPLVDSENGNCAAATVVGTVTTEIGTGTELLPLAGTLNNVQPADPDDEPARFAANFNVVVGPYDLGKLSIPVTAEIVTGAQPSDLSIKTHTVIPQRYEGVPVRLRSMEIELDGMATQGTPEPEDDKPFMINPSRCNTHTFSADMKSVEDEVVVGTKDFTTLYCDNSLFDPNIETEIPTGQGGIPTGFTMRVTQPSNSSTINSVKTTLPEGFEINPSFANRGGPNALQACDTAEIDNNAGAGCPASSRIGSVALDTPLLAGQRTGDVILETPGTAPNGSDRYKLAIVVDLPGAAELIVHGQAKVNGTGTGVNSGTGQVSATFENLPDLYFNNLEVTFDAGDHAMFVSPKVCGQYTTSAEFKPWSYGFGQTPDDRKVNRSDSVDIDTCSSTFNVGFTASIDDSTQAANSNFNLHIDSESTDDRLSELTIGMPVGLAAFTTATLTRCSQSAAASGNCAPAHRVGQFSTTVGAGNDPLVMTGGSIYNVIPNSDEPARLAAVMPVVVGPYDLGKLSIPVSTKIRSGDASGGDYRRYGVDAVTEIPTRFEGVAIQIRALDMTMFGMADQGTGPTGDDRPFMVNPSRCTDVDTHHIVTAEVKGQLGAEDELTDEITINNCQNAFAVNPTIAASVDPSETAEPTNFSLIMDSDASNQTIETIETVMPAGMTINPAFALGLDENSACPTAAIDAGDVSGCGAAEVGEVSLVTPLLAGTQTGKVYLEEPGNTPTDRYKLAIVIDVPGQKLVVRGNVEIDGSSDFAANDGLGNTTSGSGQITARFNEIPDLGFTNMTVSFATTERSLMTNPETCGSQAVEATIMPSGGSVAAEPVGSFVTSYDGAGAPCPAPNAEPFAPTLDVDFSTTQAAGNPDMTITVTRADKTQQLKELDFVLPTGLVADTVATPRCALSDASDLDEYPNALTNNAATATCASETRVGDVTTWVGTGNEALDLTGGIYNVETTSNDEPARLAAVVGVQVGPYDLGKLSVPITAELEGATADTLKIRTHTELPTRYEGIPVRLQSMQIKLRGMVGGKPFMINPSRCATHEISAEMTSSLGAQHTELEPFGTDGCNDGPPPSYTYTPSMRFDTISENRAGKPVGVELEFNFGAGSSSTKKISTRLPVGFNINPGIGNYGTNMTCDAADVQAGGSACPTGSHVGDVVINTPLLKQPQLGRVYLEHPGTGFDNRYRLGIFVQLPGSTLYIPGRATVSGSSDHGGGKGSVNSGTGQVIAEFENLPDLQISSMEVTFKTSGSGNHAMLINPDNPGTYVAIAKLVPHASPSDVEFTAADSVQIAALGGTPGALSVGASFSNNWVGRPSDVEISLGRPDGNKSIKRSRFQLPDGLVGSADALPTCAAGAGNAADGICPANTKVGDVEVGVGSEDDPFTMTGEVYNVAPPADRPAALTFAAQVEVGPYDLGKIVVPIDVNIHPDEYYLWAETEDMPQRFEGIAVRISSMSVQMFGYADRATQAAIDAATNLSEYQTAVAGAPVGAKPFMRNPRSCGNDLQLKAEVTYADNQKVDVNPYTVPAFQGCDDLDLDDNTIEVSNNFPSQDNNQVPEAPTKLLVKVGQGTQPTQAAMKDMTLKLPSFRISAAAADQVSPCTDAQLEAFNCPDESRIGTVWLDTTLLPKNEYQDPQNPSGDQHSVWGAAYLLTPGTTEGDRYKMAIQMTGKTNITIRGIADVVESGPNEGEMETRFTDLPDIPFEEMQVELDGITVGSNPTRPLLLNPENSTASPQLITDASASMNSHSDPTVIDKPNSVAPTSDMQVLAGGAKSFSPDPNYSLTTSQSGGHPDFTTTIVRPDGQKDIRNVKMSLPAGFLGSAAAVPLCPLAQAAAGNCSSQSEVGTVMVDIGQYGQYLTRPGKVYMTEGATVGGAKDIAGMSIKVRAVAGQNGEYDLGDFIAQGRVTIRKSDHGIDVDFTDVPRLFKGVPTHLHEMVVEMKGVRNGNPMLFNSSNCAAQQLTVTMDSWGEGAEKSTHVQNRPYQATGCGSRSFAPAMSFTAIGGGIGDPPAWTIKLGNNFGDSTMKATQVVLPSAITINVAGLNQACPADVAVNAANCPDVSRIGTVSISTPLLTTPVNGTVYMAKSLDGQSLPDMLIDIPAPINMQIRGVNRFTGPEFDLVQSTFNDLPDMIFTEMTMNIAGGPTGLIMLRADGGVCGSAQTSFTSHAGQQVNQPTPILGIEGFCRNKDVQCRQPTIKVSTKGVKKNKNKKVQTKFSFSTGANCNDVKSVRVTFPKGSKFDAKKLKGKKNVKNLTGKVGSKNVRADAFKASRAVMQFKSPFPAGTRSFSMASKNSALVMPYKTFCGDITKKSHKSKYRSALKKCKAKKVTFKVDVTNQDGSTYTYNYTTTAGNKAFK